MGTIKRRLAEIGRLSARPLPMALQSSLQPALDGVRAAGAAVLRGLPDAHRGGGEPPQPPARHAGFVLDALECQSAPKVARARGHLKS